MGLNTGVIILNDSLIQIEQHPEEFVNGLSVAMSQFWIHQRRVDISVCGHANAASVFHQSHADDVGVYAIGGNYTSKFVLTRWNQGHHQDEQKLALLKVIADEMGYTLVRKRKKK